MAPFRKEVAGKEPRKTPSPTTMKNTPDHGKESGPKVIRDPGDSRFDPYLDCPVCGREFDRIKFCTQHMNHHIWAFGPEAGEKREILDRRESARLRAYLALSEAEKINPKTPIFNRQVFARNDPFRLGRAGRNKALKAAWSDKMAVRRSRGHHPGAGHFLMAAGPSIRAPQIPAAPGNAFAGLPAALSADPTEDASDAAERVEDERQEGAGVDAEEKFQVDIWNNMFFGFVQF